MSHESRAQWTLIGATAIVVGLLMAFHGLSFPKADIVPVLLTSLALGGGAAYYHYRRVPSFVLCLDSLLRITTYTVCYTLLMYSIGAIGAPWIDGHLASFDESLGVYLPAIVDWANSHPGWQQFFQGVYASLLPQTALTVIVLGFANNPRILNGFVREFMLASLICAGIFAVAPAEGPFVAYDFPASPSQERYLEHIHQLREGTRTVISWNGAEGLISFPSFHTAWAILLAWSFREKRVLLAASCLLNAAVIVSTLTTGWHYFADVVAGTGTAGLAIMLSAQWAARVSSSSAEAQSLPVAHSNPQPLRNPQA